MCENSFGLKLNPAQTDPLPESRMLVDARWSACAAGNGTSRRVMPPSNRWSTAAARAFRLKAEATKTNGPPWPAGREFESPRSHIPASSTPVCALHVRCNPNMTVEILRDFGKVVGARGFEPPTPRSRTECSTRLSHAPTKACPYSTSTSAAHAPLNHRPRKQGPKKGAIPARYRQVSLSSRKELTSSVGSFPDGMVGMSFAPL
jgi:hypothetical protein